MSDKNDHQFKYYLSLKIKNKVQIFSLKKMEDFLLLIYFSIVYNILFV